MRHLSKRQNHHKHCVKVDRFFPPFCRNQTFSLLFSPKKLLLQAVTKIRNGMEWNGTLRNFPVNNNKGFDLGLGIPKSKFLGFRESDCTASEQKVHKRMEWNSLFCSIPFRVLVTTLLHTHFTVCPVDSLT